jgi:hypothetical protein
MSILSTIRDAVSRFDLADLSQAHRDAEALLSTIGHAMDWHQNSEDRADALYAIAEEVEGNMLHDITEAIGNGWADEGYEIPAARLLEGLAYQLETVVEGHSEELATVTV